MANGGAAAAATGSLFVIAVFFLSNALVTNAAEDDFVRATCTVKKNSGVAPVHGVIRLSQKASGGKTTLVVDLKGFNHTLRVTKHGFHVHEKGNLSESCNGAGAHYNPKHKSHGAPSDSNRHVGDLGNVEVNTEGEVQTEIKDSLVSLIGKYSVIGRAIVVHELQDDLGRGGFNDSKTTGHAGRRLGCCIIRRNSRSNAGHQPLKTGSYAIGAKKLVAMLVV